MADKKQMTSGQKGLPKASHEHTLQDSVNRTEEFYQKNTKLVNGIGIIIVLIVGIYFGYKYIYAAPRETKAEAMGFKAQQYFEKDSLNEALNGDGNNYGFLRVIDRYGDTRMGQTATYCAGVIYIRQGQYSKGLQYLKQFQADDKIVQAEAYGMMGDAYMELGNTSEGVRYYEKAGEYNDDELISPLYLLRAGLALEKEGKPKEAIDIYKEIKSKYPQTLQGKVIDKYLARLGDYE